MTARDRPRLQLPNGVSPRRARVLTLTPTRRVGGFEGQPLHSTVVFSQSDPVMFMLEHHRGNNVPLAAAP